MTCRADGNQCTDGCGPEGCLKYPPPRGIAKVDDKVAVAGREALALIADGQRWRQLKRLCGYVQDGSDTTVSLAQDDATRSYLIQVGKTTYHGTSFEEALAKAMEGDKCS